MSKSQQKVKDHQVGAHRRHVMSPFVLLSALAGKEADQLSFTLRLLGGSKQSTDSRYRPVYFYAGSISGVEV